MADRTWNAIESRILDEDWNKVTILVMEQLIIKCPNQYGVYKLPLGFLNRFFNGMLAEDQFTVKEAIDELLQDGAIKIYDDVVWIVNKWNRDKYSKVETNRKGAIAFVEGHFPNVAPDFRTKYRLSPTKMPKSGTSDSDSDSDSDTEPDKKKRKTPARKPRGNAAVARWVDLHKEIYGEKFIITPILAKHIALAFKALSNDIDEFDKRVRNCLADPWYKEKRPGPSYFYQHINKYATVNKKDPYTVV